MSVCLSHSVILPKRASYDYDVEYRSVSSNFKKLHTSVVITLFLIIKT